MNYVDQIRKDFENLLKQSKWWSRSIGSQFVAYISLFIAQTVERVQRVADRALQESFLSLATNRTSILAGAESVGYVGLKISPSIGIVTITNKGDKRVTLPALTQCVAANQLRYTIMESVDLQAGESKDYQIQQFEVAVMEHIVSDRQNWLAIAFPKELTKRIHKVLVRVNGELWEHAFKFRNTNSYSKAYMEYYKSTDQLGIRFGNDICGRAPISGDLIQLEVWLTEGDTTLLDGQKLELIDSTDFTGTTIPVELVTKTTVTGGAEGEDIESIRNGALYSTVYDHQLAWDGDYQAFIRNNISGIVWLSVWGEQEQEKLIGKQDVKNINRIFISAFSNIKDENVIEGEIVTLFSGKNGYNEVYEYVPRKDAPFTVNVTGYVVANSSPKDAEEAVKAQLEYLFGKNTKDKGSIYVKDVWRAIEAMAVSLGIDEYEVDCVNLLEEVPIDTYLFLDVVSSSFKFTHRPV
ncbi:MULTISPECIES: hypothetical protein [unclassified Vibrio]|uniref:hypothetical protein n=1 Tax=unclassified Vibrio TaxID=2614977 RepID=UPI001267F405|nr:MULTISPECIES: hypothetical protein [unclassified Vibrio]QFT40121.1 hypothetical protein FIU99_27395 [Vibrio sp. THAF64]QGM37944.1 hypothetical protein GGC04_26990 [Vibrio sp. THAF191d]QGN73475.1 hypothetical protein GGC03_27180 [Vibrio sp. THAF191c]